MGIFTPKKLGFVGPKFQNFYVVGFLWQIRSSKRQTKTEKKTYKYQLLLICQLQGTLQSKISTIFVLVSGGFPKESFGYLTEYISWGTCLQGFFFRPPTTSPKPRGSWVINRSGHLFWSLLWVIFLGHFCGLLPWVIFGGHFLGSLFWVIFVFTCDLTNVSKWQVTPRKWPSKWPPKSDWKNDAQRWPKKMTHKSDHQSQTPWVMGHRSLGSLLGAGKKTLNV